MDDQSLSHTRYNCTYHVVFIPKYRRKVMMERLKNEVAVTIKKVCELIGVKLVRGGVCKDHVHLYLSIPPKMSISTVMSKIKGKSALMIFDKHPDMRGKLGRHFWARGYYVETVGNVNEEVIEEYIKNQEESDQILG